LTKCHVNFFFFLNTDFNALERKNCVAVKDTSFLIHLKVQSLYFLKTVISNETFEVVLGTSSFLARHEVYGNTTENLVPCWRPYF